MMELNEYKLVKTIKNQTNHDTDNASGYRLNIFNGIQVSHGDDKCEHHAFAPEEIEFLTYMAIRDFDRATTARDRLSSC